MSAHQSAERRTLAEDMETLRRRDAGQEQDYRGRHRKA